ncbi:MAG: glycosyltransferase family 4 protein [Patescibacteria group bacterium]
MRISKPKKVIFVINNFAIGGVEKLLLDIISRLDKQKFTISIVTVFGSGPLESSFRQLKVPIYFVAGKFPFHHKRLPYKIYWLVIAPIILARLVWWFWHHRPAVVVTSLYQSDVLGMLASRLAGVHERVLIHHDTYPVGRSKAWLKRKIGVGLATRIVAVSQTVKDFVINYFGASADHVIIIPNGINTNRFSNGDKSPDYSNLVLGMLGRLESVKGPMVFLQALQILQIKFGLTPPSHLGGEGSLRSELINYATQAQLYNLTLDGEIRDVPDWLRKIDILVVPSIREGFGLVVLEGLIAKKIVVASDLLALHDLISDYDNGLLFKVGDAASLAEIIVNLLSNRELFAQIKSGVCRWRREKRHIFDIANVATAYDALLLDRS